ncbi:PREDICTED: uncharacterized protein LOC104813829 [Tarenaya hassleriana]|uniref:uncharacterized protein LOC104813829 n=1 Tax=Tarenaya hassleriana TaxID=28532 RepID=UPI00053C0A93|nr:PREDICTED: uncharacterized protein LOC104813829 [Tarenaya hassleriana]
MASSVTIAASMTIMLLLLLSTSIGSAKGETDCNRVADNLHHYVHENCRDGPTSMCGAYCFKDSGGACNGKCHDRKCSCFPTCDIISKTLVAYFWPDDGYGYRMCDIECRGQTGSEQSCFKDCAEKVCDAACGAESLGYCKGRRANDVSCQCFRP